MRHVTVAAAFAALLISTGAATPARSTGETVRIRAHFDSVLAELSARDVRDLSPAQQAQRGRIVATLRGYRDRGVFPQNYDFPGQAVPYFVDRKTGTLCAVAYLLGSTGRRDIVDRVAAMDNNVWVRALAPDTAFNAWLGRNGLTLEEAARIQMPYMVPTLPPPPPSVKPVSGARVTRIAAIGGVSLVTAFFSTRTYLRHRQTVAARREAERTRVTIAPVVSPSNGAGLAVSLKF